MLLNKQKHESQKVLTDAKHLQHVKQMANQTLLSFFRS